MVDLFSRVDSPGTGVSISESEEELSSFIGVDASNFVCREITIAGFKRWSSCFMIVDDNDFAGRVVESKGWLFCSIEVDVINFAGKVALVASPVR